MLVRPVFEIVDRHAVPDGDAWLGSREQVVLGRLRVPKRRDDWRLGRYAAKRLLAPLAGIGRGASELERIEILAASDGAPSAHLDGEPWDLALSISHAGSRGLAACAPAGTALGCDIECVEPRSPAFVDTFFCDRERSLCAEARSGQAALLTNAIWSAKESVLKALRIGLRADTRSVEAIPMGWEDRAARWRPVVLHVAAPFELCGWWHALGGSVVTLAASAPCARPLFQCESSRSISSR